MLSLQITDFLQVLLWQHLCGSFFPFSFCHLLSRNCQLSSLYEFCEPAVPVSIARFKNIQAGIQFHRNFNVNCQKHRYHTSKTATWHKWTYRTWHGIKKSQTLSQSLARSTAHVNCYQSRLIRCSSHYAWPVPKSTTKSLE